MPAHYGIAIVADEHKNALNVVLALWQGEDPTLSENLGQPLNASGLANDPPTHWMGGRPYGAAELEIIQNLPANLPAVSWPVQGVGGAVDEAAAIAAAAALSLMVGTADSYGAALVQQTLASALGAQGLKRAEDA